ncbi:MAG: cell wall hydrolase [Xanthobacteraceae bacterium]|jgi:hypothetical protein
MVASRNRLMSACYPARFWLSACLIALMPTSIGYQDLAALIARDRGGAAASWHMIASPFGTVEAATFRYTRPIGSTIPEPLGLFQTVNFDPRSLDAYAWKIDEPLTERPARQIDYPSVNRTHKGDRLPASNVTPAPSDPARLPQLQPINAPANSTDAPPARPAPPAVPTLTKADRHADLPAASPTAPQMDAHDDAAAPTPAAPAGHDAAAHAGAADDEVIADKPPELPAPGEINEASSPLGELSFLDDDAGDRSGQVYFGSGAMGSPAGLQRWEPGAEPILVTPADSGIKLAALEETDGEIGANATIAGKDNSRLLSPAQQLGLEGKPRARAEKCLADAVYFEARGEVVKGQEAVAQVVMNRVFSGVYPHDVCGVVYQNANRHLACQFTFACENKDLNKIDEPDMWEQAKRIAKDMLDGKIWLAEVAHATHYHAYWVHPSWVHEMAKLYHLGVHTFYRPLNWGNGDDEPVWGKGPAAIGVRLDPEVLSEDPQPAPKSFEGEVKGPQAAVTAAPLTDKSAPTTKL